MVLSKRLISTLQETTRVFLVWAYHKYSDADNVVTYHTNRNYTEQAMQVVFPPVEMTSTPPAVMAKPRILRSSSGCQCFHALCLGNFSTCFEVALGH